MNLPWLSDEAVRELATKELAPYVCYGKYTLASGHETDTYFDVKSYLYSSRGLAICFALNEVLRRLAVDHPDLIATPAMGLTPIMSGIASLTGVRTATVLKEPKDHGIGEGSVTTPHFPPDKMNVLLVDDVYTTGRSLFGATQRLIHAGHRVVAWVALVDRCINPVPMPVRYGYPFKALTTMEELVRASHALNSGCSTKTHGPMTETSS